MKTLWSVALAAALLVGCRTTTGEFDPVRTEQVVGAVQVVVSTPITIILVKEKQDDATKAEAIAAYFRGVGRVYCAVRDTKRFDPNVLLVELNKVVTDLVRDELEVLLIKNAVVGLYGAFFAQRFSAELDAEAWPYHVADAICRGVDQGLKDAGMPGIDGGTP